MCCKRCLAEPASLHAMSPLSYSTQLCEVCLGVWEERKHKIMLAALDLFVAETPEPQVASDCHVIQRINPREKI